MDSTMERRVVWRVVDGHRGCLPDLVMILDEAGSGRAGH